MWTLIVFRGQTLLTAVTLLTFSLLTQSVHVYIIPGGSVSILVVRWPLLKPWVWAKWSSLYAWQLKVSLPWNFLILFFYCPQRINCIDFADPVAKAGLSTSPSEQMHPKVPQRTSHLYLEREQFFHGVRLAVPPRLCSNPEWINQTKQRLYIGLLPFFGWRSSLYTEGEEDEVQCQLVHVSYCLQNNN